MRRSRRKGGAATALPLHYFGAAPSRNNVSAGYDLLPVSNQLIRPRIGGKRRKAKTSKRSKGGFIPSVMDGFAIAASKYVVPLALFSGYKLLTKKKKHSKRR